MASNAGEFDTTICAACGKKDSDDNRLKQCSSCKLVAYCNVECQRTHRKEHRELCKLEAKFIKRRARTQHYTQVVMNPDEDVGFMYTVGITNTHPSKVELITLDVHRDDVQHVGSLVCFLAERLLDGYDVRPYQNAAENDGRDGKYCIVPLDDGDRRKLLENYATKCDVSFCAYHVFIFYVHVTTLI